MFSLKMHRAGPDTVLACCDRTLLGRKLTGEADIHVSEGFYGGEDADERRFLDLMRGATIANLMGDSIVALAVKEGIVDEKNVITVCGVKHAQVVTLQ